MCGSHSDTLDFSSLSHLQGAADDKVTQRRVDLMLAVCCDLDMDMAGLTETAGRASSVRWTHPHAAALTMVPKQASNCFSACTAQPKFLFQL